MSSTSVLLILTVLLFFGTPSINTLTNIVNEKLRLKFVLSPLTRVQRLVSETVSLEDVPPTGGVTPPLGAGPYLPLSTALAYSFWVFLRGSS